MVRHTYLATCRRWARQRRGWAAGRLADDLFRQGWLQWATFYTRNGHQIGWPLLGARFAAVGEMTLPIRRRNAEACSEGLPLRLTLLLMQMLHRLAAAMAAAGNRNCWLLLLLLLLLL